MADPSTRSRHDLPSGTVTFLLTDVEGSTALWEPALDEMRTVLGETAFAAALGRGAGDDAGAGGRVRAGKRRPGRGGVRG